MSPDFHDARAAEIVDSTESFNPQSDISIVGTGPDVLILVHGFGVQRDSRGMFTEVARYFADHYTSVLFDLNQVEGDEVTLRTLTEQRDIVRQVLAAARAKHPGARVHLLGHSMGCVVASLAGDSELDSVIFLAPPTRSGGDSTRRYFMAYKGAQLDGRILTVPRKDGTTTVIPLDYFDDMERHNPAQLITEYAAAQPLHVIEALEEDVIRHADYSVFQSQPGIVLRAIHGDHNWTGDARAGLLAELSHLLGGEDK